MCGVSLPKISSSNVLSRLSLKPVPNRTIVPDMGMGLLPSMGMRPVVPVRSLHCTQTGVQSPRELLNEAKSNHPDEDIERVLDRYVGIKTQLDNMVREQQQQILSTSKPRGNENGNKPRGNENGSKPRGNENGNNPREIESKRKPWKKENRSKSQANENGRKTQGNENERQSPGN